MFSKNIFIGPAGWNYPDWKGIVYPAQRSRGFSELEYISRYFNTVEVNSTFYRIPSEKSVLKWLQAVNKSPEFLFCIKLWQGFTHNDNKYHDKDAQLFINSMHPLIDNKKLGALLIQFPWRFKNNAQNLGYVVALFEQFKLFPCAVEFRHSSWQNEQILKFFRESKITFVNIDQPVIGDSIKPSGFSTAKTGYIRFHGRNYKSWFNESMGRDARYDYLYNDKELTSWLDNIEKTSADTEKTFIIFNNHFRGQAVINAFQLVAKLYQTKPLVPESLINWYPNLKLVAKADIKNKTLDLF